MRSEDRRIKNLSSQIVEITDAWLYGTENIGSVSMPREDLERIERLAERIKAIIEGE